MTDAELRDIYTRALTSRATLARTECPPPEALEALVTQRGTEESRLATLDHVMSCDACRQEFELLRAIYAAETAEKRARPPRWRAPWLVAAAIVVAVGAITLARQQRANPLRGGGPAGDIALVGLVDHALVWRAIPGAVRYDVETVDANGATVFHATTTDTSVAIVSPAGAVNWWVRATLRDGTERRSAVVPVR